jgi:hypothetical protein
MQQALMKQLQERMSQNLAAMAPEALLRTWLPASIQNFEQMQKLFWSQFQGDGGWSRT